MPQSLLEQLRKYTTVVADTGDIESMERFRPTDATTNPSLITTAAGMPQYQPIVDGVIMDAKKDLGDGAADKDVADPHLAGLAARRQPLRQGGRLGGRRGGWQAEGDGHRGILIGNCVTTGCARNTTA